MADSHDAALEGRPADAGATQPAWAAIKDAIRGTHHDYTEGPIGRAIFLLAVPMVLETVMESVFAVVDVFFVSRLGADAVATVGLTESMMVLVYSLAMGLGIGATATVARRIGERDADGAAHAAAQAILLGLDHLGRARHRRGRAGAHAPSRDGRIARRHRQRLVHACDARRERDGAAAVPHQRGLPRRR